MRSIATRLFALALVAELCAFAPAQTTEVVSRSLGGAQANDSSAAYYDQSSNFIYLGCTISNDGRYVLYSSLATNLAPGDTNGAMDIFMYDGVTTAVTRLSVDAAGVQGNSDSYYPSMSTDGRYVAFASSASNLAANDTNGAADVFVKDRQTGSVTRISVDSSGVQGNGNSTVPVISGNGRYVAFLSYATNLWPGTSPSSGHVFVHDTQTGTTVIADVSSAGVVGNGNPFSTFPSISSDGRYVAFASLSSNLVPGDTNGVSDAFVRDTLTGTTTRVGQNCASAVISADGRYVAFDTSLTECFVHDTQTGTDTLVSIDFDGTTLGAYNYSPAFSPDARFVSFVHDLNDGVETQIYVRDIQAGVSYAISSDSTATQWANGISAVMFNVPSMSADDHHMVFMSSATNVVAGDTNGKFDVFVHDLQTGVNTRVSVSGPGFSANSVSGGGESVSGDGRYVAYNSFASNIVAGDTNGAWDVFVLDRQTGTTVRASVASNGTQGNQDSGLPAITPDGRYIAFRSRSDNLVAGDTNNNWDMFVRDLQLGQTTRVSTDSAGAQSNGVSYEVVAISADGRYVAFASDATNLVPGDTNGAIDVFVKDRQTGAVTRVSVDSSGAQANQGAYSTLAMSADGRYVAFGSASTNLVANDTNGQDDVFVHDRQTGVTKLVSVNLQGGSGTGSLGSTQPSLSADGRYVAFTSFATDLVAGDTNGFVDVFVRDMVAGVTTRVDVGLNGAQSNGATTSNPILSPDGRFVVFDSSASNLVTGDTNADGDVFLYDRIKGTTERVSLSASGAEANNTSFGPAGMSADARYIAFASNASNLAPADTNGSLLDVFLRDRGAASSFVSMCFGDGTGAACPCANSGLPGHGCQNSGSTGGALLTGSGVASLSADSVHLTSSGEMPSSSSIVLQGDAVIAQIPFGNGLRCTGGHLKRPYTANASGGVLNVPPSGQPSFSARSAALGDPIAAGSTRIYQVYYHDPNLTFCPNGFNVSNAIAVAWGI